MAPGYNTPVEAPPNVVITPITAELIGKLRVSPAATDTAAAGLLQSPKVQPYRIGPHDILSISVWDFGGTKLDVTPVGFGLNTASGYVVAEDGTIFFPFAGKVRVAGRTTDEVRRLLAARIKDTILNPQIDVSVAEYRSRKVYVVGEVAKPGEESIKDTPLTILDAISLAGGATKSADLTGVTLTRDGKVYNLDLLALLKDGEVGHNVLLRDGDVVYVPDNNARKVYVIGEVNKPGSLLMTDRRLTLTEAINDVGGVDRTTSNPARIYVIRGTRATPRVYRLDAADPVALILGDRFPLRPHDVVYVDTSGLTRWSRVINQVLPTATFFGQPNVFNTTGR